MNNEKYTLVWKLVNEKGETWEEDLEEITLSDFEEIYGANSYKIIEIELRMVDNG